MSRINRVPFGLQDLLGSQNFGDNPSELGGVVAPVLDMSPYLTAERYSYKHDTDVLADNGQITTFLVPDGEIWYVLAVGGALEPASGTPIVDFGGNIGAFIFDVPNSNNPGSSHPVAGMQFRNETPVALSSVADEWQGVEFTHPIPLLGGSRIRFILSGIYGDTSWNTTVAVRYIRLNQ